MAWHQGEISELWLVDETQKGSPLSTKHLLFGNGRGSIYFVVLSQDSRLLGLCSMLQIETKWLAFDDVLPFSFKSPYP